MELKLNVTKKAYEMNGKKGTYYSYTVDFEGETFKFKVDDKDKKMLNHFLDKCDIPLEREDRKEELVNRLMAGEYLSEAEKSLLHHLLIDEEGGGD